MIYNKPGFIQLHTVYFLILFTPFGAMAENLLDVYKLAQLNDANYQAAKNRFYARGETIPQARSNLLPEIAITGERSKVEQEVLRSESPAIPEEESDIYNTNLSVTLTQPLYRRTSWIEYKQSKVIFTQAEVELAIAKQQLMISVAEAYFNALAAQDNLQYSQIEKTAVAKQLKDAKSRNKAGMGRITDVYDAESRFALSESRMIEAEIELDDKLQALQQLTDVFVKKLVPLKENVELIETTPEDLQKWTDSAMSHNLELEFSQLSLELADHNIDRFQAEHFPTLELVASRSRRDTKGPEFGSSDGEIDNTLYLIRFNLPIYQGGGTQSRMREAILNKDKAFAELEGQRRKIYRDTRLAYQNVANGIRKVAVLEKSIKSHQDALEVKKKGLKSGIITLLEVLDAQRELYFAQRQFSQARYDYLLNILKLKQATGSLSEVDLEKTNTLLQ